MLEAMWTQGQRMQFALNAHGTHLLPSLNRIHGGPYIGIAVNKEHRSGLQVEVEFRNQNGAVVVAACRIVNFATIRKRVGRIDADSLLNITGQLIYVVDGQVRLLL